MLRDNINNTYPNQGCLSAIDNQESIAILSFIDSYIAGFKSYYITQNTPYRENRISDLLVQYLQCCKINWNEGFGLYDFRKNPTQEDSGKETDIGVYLLSTNITMLPIFEFEAKRLSNSKEHKPNNKEYVAGDRGGIERFKKCEHSPHLNECGMFGYIHSDNADHWIGRINLWIQEASNSGSNLDWSSENEKLSVLNKYSEVSKCKSENSRVQSKSPIHLWHYMIELI